MTANRMMPHAKSLAVRLPKAKGLDGGDPLLLTIPEAAARLRIGESKMRNLCNPKRGGTIKTVMIGRAVRIAPAELDRYVAGLVEK